MPGVLSFQSFLSYTEELARSIKYTHLVEQPLPEQYNLPQMETLPLFNNGAVRWKHMTFVMLFMSYFI